MIQLRSHREIQKLRYAGLVVWEAHHCVSQRVVECVTTQQLDAVVESVFERFRAVPLFKGVPGKFPFPAVTCISVNEQVVHGIPGPRVLTSGDIVSVDTGCRLDGWCGDSAVTYAVGGVSPGVQELLDVTSGVLQRAITWLGTMSRWSQVAREMATYVRDHGFSVVEDFVGHGIGRQMHEDPEVPNYDSPRFRRRGDFPLRPGLVLAIEPMVNMGTKQVKCLDDAWTQVTLDGAWSAHFEHTVALTEQGPWILTGPPTTAELAWLESYGATPQ